jgi:hypothetical protein
MHHRILTIVLVAICGLSFTASAGAAKAPHRYSPKHGAKCRKAYKRVKHGKRVYCVKRKAKKKAATPPAAAPLVEKTKLHSHLDPTFTRDPLDPFKVTYAYSASATQQSFSTESLALGAEEPAPLPSGVLALYSDGRLECAVNVGSGVEGSECPVDYSALGQHTVTTIYSSGEQSATETEVETITPLATETTLSLSYSPIETQEGQTIKTGSGLYHLGDLSITVGSTPAAKADLDCGGTAVEHLSGSGCYEVGSAVDHVYGNDPSGCLQSVRISASTNWEVVADAESLSPADLESGRFHLRAAVPTGDGYGGSEATAPLQFDPELSFAPDC